MNDFFSVRKQILFFIGGQGHPVVPSFSYDLKQYVQKKITAGELS